MSNDSQPEASTTEDFILIEGKQLLSSFMFTDPLMREIYEKVFCCITEERAQHPFSITSSRTAAKLGIDTEKGILLVGTAGVGMSVLFRTIQQVLDGTDMQFKTVSQQTICSRVNRDIAAKYEILYEYGKNLHKDLLVDDIDPDREHEELKQTMQYIYDERQKLHLFKGYKTYLTMTFSTNGKDDPTSQAHNFLLRAYGRYIYDLLTKMCNILVWEGTNLRSTAAR